MTDCFYYGDEENNLFFEEDIKRSAKSFLKLFFKDKKDYRGNLVSNVHLGSPLFISTVMKYTDIGEGFDAIYKIIAQNRRRLAHEIRFEKKYADIKYAAKLREECASLGIPKCFVAGVIILYLKVCKGCWIEI